jgi:hypothetical protein
MPSVMTHGGGSLDYLHSCSVHVRLKVHEQISSSVWRKVTIVLVGNEEESSILTTVYSNKINYSKVE